MTKRVTIFTISFLLALAVNAQGDIHCNTQILKETDKNIDKLSAEQVGRFLLTLSKECEESAEFSEWSNELLFDVLTRYPITVIQIMDYGSVDNDEILQEIATPVNDGIDLNGILNKVKAVQSSGKSKAKVIAKLNEAIQKG